MVRQMDGGRNCYSAFIGLGKGKGAPNISGERRDRYLVRQYVMYRKCRSSKASSLFDFPRRVRPSLARSPKSQDARSRVLHDRDCEERAAEAELRIGKHARALSPFVATCIYAHVRVCAEGPLISTRGVSGSASRVSLNVRVVRSRWENLLVWPLSDFPHEIENLGRVTSVLRDTSAHLLASLRCHTHYTGPAQQRRDSHVDERGE